MPQQPPNLCIILIAFHFWKPHVHNAPRLPCQYQRRLAIQSRIRSGGRDAERKGQSAITEGNMLKGKEGTRTISLSGEGPPLVRLASTPRLEVKKIFVTISQTRFFPLAKTRTRQIIQGSVSLSLSLQLRGQRTGRLMCRARVHFLVSKEKYKRT